MKVGPYTLRRELGRGGMAQVILANRVYDDGKKKPCIIKMPRKSTALDPKILRQFHIEAEIAMTLQHEGIVDVFDTGTHEGLPYLVMAYISGLNLRELSMGMMNAGLRWDVETAVHVTREVGHALAYIHEATINEQAQRIIHRDVAAKNIMITMRGGVKLADFGVATSVNTDSTINSVKGTLPYMAPEHYAGQACPASDTFSLGAVLWEMLAQQAFREGIPQDELPQAVIDGKVPPLPPNSAPPEVTKLVEGMLHPSPSRRMKLQEFLTRVEEYPGARIRVKRMIEHVTGNAVQSSGCSAAHFAASPELMQTFAVARAGGITSPLVHDQSRRVPFLVSRALEDLEPESVPGTAEHGPPLRQDDDGSPGVASLAKSEPAGTPDTVVVRPPADPGASQTRIPETHRLSPVIGSSRPAPTEEVPPPERVPPKSTLEKRSTAHSAAANAGAAGDDSSPASPVSPRESSAPVVQVEAGSESPSSQRAANGELTGSWSRWAVAGVAFLAMLAGLAVLSLRFGETADSTVIASEPSPDEQRDDAAHQVRNIEPVVVAVAGPEAMFERNASSGSSGELLFDEEQDPRTDVGADETGAPAEEMLNDDEAPADGSLSLGRPAEVQKPPPPQAAPPAPPRARKEARPLVQVVIKRGFVNHAEIRIGNGRARLVPGKGSLKLSVPAGRRRVRWRTTPEGEWQSKSYQFRANVAYHCLVNGESAKIAEDSSGGMGQ